MHDPRAAPAKIEVNRSQDLRARVVASDYSKLVAPNTSKDLTFDDFVLFTRTLKALAGNLCAATIPTDDELYAAAISDAGVSGRLKALKSNPMRLENSIVGFYRDKHGIPEMRARKLACKVMEAR